MGYTGWHKTMLLWGTWEAQGSATRGTWGHRTVLLRVAVGRGGWSQEEEPAFVTGQSRVELVPGLGRADRAFLLSCPEPGTWSSGWWLLRVLLLPALWGSLSHPHHQPFSHLISRPPGWAPAWRALSRYPLPRPTQVSDLGCWYPLALHPLVPMERTTNTGDGFSPAILPSPWVTPGTLPYLLFRP